MRRPRRGRPSVVVLGLNYSPETTGIAPYTTGLARHLATGHREVTVVTGHPHYPAWELADGYTTPRPPEVDQGVRLVRVPHPVPADPGGPARVWMEAVFAVRAARQLLRMRPDVVVVVSPALLSVVPAIMLGPLLRWRVGVWVQDLYGAALAETGVAAGRLARVTGWLESRLLRRADRVAVIHEVFRARLVSDGVPADSIQVIANWSHVTPADDADRLAARAELGWADDDVVALHAGNMGLKQGLEGLVDVAAEAARRGSRVRVVLLGDGSRRAALEEYAAATAPLARLDFLDPLPEGSFEAALAAADVLLLHEKPGVVEMSVPSKLTTYFSAGRPVVAATDPASGAASLMAAAGAGPVVRSGDAESILIAVEQLAADPDAAHHAGSLGRRYAHAHLAGPASLAAYDEWVDGLLSGGPPT